MNILNKHKKQLIPFMETIYKKDALIMLENFVKETPTEKEIEQLSYRDYGWIDYTDTLDTFCEVICRFKHNIIGVSKISIHLAKGMSSEVIIHEGIEVHSQKYVDSRAEMKRKNLI